MASFEPAGTGAATLSTAHAASISIAHVSISFPTPGGDDVQVVQDINLAIPEGQFVSIVGPSGCGKSTLLRAISGLVHPSKGQVHIHGESVEQTRRRIGFMFQRDTLLPWASVHNNVQVGTDLAGIKGDAANQRIRELLEFLQLSDFVNHRPHQLSGGMRQRVSLGRLLAYEPDIFLMDEPFGALDAQTKSAMGQELLRVWSKHKRTVVFVTHDIEEAVTLSDRVLVMSPRPGKLVLDMPINLDRPRNPRALRKNPDFIAAADQLWEAISD